MHTKMELAQGILEYGEDAALTYGPQLAELIVNERPMRYALVDADAGQGEQLKAYMPGNYEIVGRTPIGASNRVRFLIAGRDSCGWTLDDYVIPRLASGMYHAVEILP